MKRTIAVALVVGVLTASCSGMHGSGSALPPVGASSQASAPSTMGAQATRGAVGASAPAGWAATATAALPLANATDLGAVSPSQAMTVRVGLQMRNVDALKQIVASGGQVSKAAFASTYAPASAPAVAAYLQKEGFKNVVIEPNHMLVSGTGTADRVERAFDTKIHAFSASQLGRVYANTTPAYVPQSLAGSAVAVLGLNDVQGVRPTPKHGGTPETVTPAAPGTPPSPCSLYGLEILGFPTPVAEPKSPAGCLRNYRPADYWRAYDTGKTAAATGISVAIMTAGQLANAISDLRVNERADNIPQVPVYVKPIGVPGGAITDGPDEWTLDMTASSGMAGALRSIYVYNTTSLNDADIVTMYNRWVTDDLTKIANSSFGGCEALNFLDGSMLMADQILLEGASQRQTMFASSGDTGSFCPVLVGANGVPAGVPGVNWPASSSYAVAVGGTTLLTMSDGAYQGETAWYSTGGGASAVEYSPAWQTSTQPAAAEGILRGVPDIAMDGDLQTGMILYTTDFKWTVIGGTSLSSPLAAGVWARMLQAHGTRLGYAPPRLYRVYVTHTSGSPSKGPPPWEPYGGYHDILVGGDGAYTAAPKYDYVSGMGSFDVSATSAIIAQ